MRKLLQNLFLSLLSVTVALLVFEVGTQIYVGHVASNDDFLKYASLRQLKERSVGGLPLITPHRYLGYYPTPNYVAGPNRHNSLGYRGDEIDIPKPSGEFRIVCLGGSTTYTGKVGDYRKTYPYRLGQLLRQEGYSHARVINGGVSGWNSRETLINFQLRVLDLEPDLIIVYHGINDVHPRLVWPSDAYRGDNSGGRAPMQPSLFMPSPLEYSALYRFVMVRSGAMRPHSSFERTVDLTPDTYYGDNFHLQARQGRYPQGLFLKVSVMDMLDANPPVYFERNLRNLVALAQSHEVETVLSSFAYSPRFPNEPRVASAEYQRALAEGNEVVRRVAETTPAHYFDFAANFPEKKDLWTDGRHVNEQGALLKARHFVHYLLQQQLVPAASDD